MKYCIATDAYWKSLGFVTDKWKKSSDGKAIAEKDDAEILKLGLVSDSNITILTREQMVTELAKAVWTQTVDDTLRAIADLDYLNTTAHVQANTYKKGNKVTSSGSLYYAKQDVPANTLITNTTYWLKIVSKGDTSNAINDSAASTTTLYSGEKIQNEINARTSTLNEVKVKSSESGMKLNTIKNRLYNANVNSETKVTTSDSLDRSVALPKDAANDGVMGYAIKGMTLNNMVNGKETANLGTVTFNTILNNKYYISLTGETITGDGNPYVVTNNSGVAKDIVVMDLTSLGLTSTSPTDLAKMTATYFDGTVSVVSPRIKSTNSDQTKTTILSCPPVKLRRHSSGIYDSIENGKYIKRVSDDGLSVLATPIVKDNYTSGDLRSYSSGTVNYDTAVYDVGMYNSGKASITSTSYPIASIESLKKVNLTTGAETNLNVANVSIASDKLSFTHPDLTNGDIVSFTYLHNVPSVVGYNNLTYYDSRYAILNAVDGKLYNWGVTVANGVPSLTKTLIP